MKTLTAQDPECRDIRVYLNGHDVTQWAWAARLPNLPYVLCISWVELLEHDNGKAVVRDSGINRERKYGVVWWAKR